MPVFTTHLQHMMNPDTPRLSSESSSSNQEHIWVVQDEYEKPQKEMDFPSARLNGKMPRHELRINTYSKTDLHERYMSSEEEPSPSPDSSDAESTHSEELKHKSSVRVLATQESVSDLSSSEVESKTAIAVAMPIVAYGRPKLIDITNIAPMQKRKRTIKQPVAPSAALNKQTLARKISTATIDETKPFIADEAAEVVVPADKATTITHKQAAMAAKRMQPTRTPSSAPESWLPVEEEEEDHKNTTLDSNEREYFFPSDADYEPYSLEPPHPTPTPSCLSNLHPQQQQQQSTPPPTQTHTRKRNNSNPFNTLVNTASLGKNVARTWSIAKKGVSSHHHHHHHHGSFSSSSTAQIALQSPSPSVSSFSQHTYQPERQITKKPKMVARGANEREEGFVLPPCPLGGPGVAVA
ncbi:MAG: hypothetical protein Q9222_005837 [Ikaeria aurantiellina]